MKPDISVIICTYNRCEGLRDTLRSLKRQRHLENLSVEIIVVDNNSSDQTPEVVRTESKESRRPILYYFEASQGKSFALNSGIRKAHADFLAFTDDDVIPDDDWLFSLWSAASMTNADCIGGRVLPIWDAEPPRWLEDKDRQFGMLALLDRGEDAILAKQASGNFLIGANIAYRKSVFAEVGLFRTDLGPKGEELSRGDDSEMMSRLFKSKKCVLYAPKAVVRHKVPRERLHIKYLRKWQFDSGKSVARISKKKDGVPKWLVRECLESGLAAVWNYVRGAQLKAISAEENFWNKLGMIAEMGKRS